MPFIAVKDTPYTGIDELDDLIKGITARVNEMYELVMKEDDFVIADSLKEEAQKLRKMLKEFAEARRSHNEEIKKIFHLSEKDMEELEKVCSGLAERVDEFISSLDAVFSSKGAIIRGQPIKKSIAPDFFAAFKTKIKSVKAIVKGDSSRG